MQVTMEASDEFEDVTIADDKVVRVHKGCAAKKTKKRSYDV